MDFHHPLFQSLALPLLVAFVATGLCRAAGAALGGADGGMRWAAAGLGPALIAAAVAVVGWPSIDFLPTSLAQKLVWAIALVWLLGGALEHLRARLALEGVLTAAAWALLLGWLGATSLASWLIAWLAGAVVIASVLTLERRSAEAPAVLALAAAGLAGVAMASASLLLMQLALACAAAFAGCAVFWLWPTPRIAFGAAGRVAAVLTLLAVGHGTARLTEAPPGALLLLSVAVAAGALLAVWRRRRFNASDERATVDSPRAGWRMPLRPLWPLAGAAPFVLAALAWAVVQGAPSTDTDGAADDAYYTPTW